MDHHDLHYDEGVQKGRKEGNIKVFEYRRDEFGFNPNDDQYCERHNLRCLSSVVRNALDQTCEKIHEPRILELGPGVGVALTQIKALVPNAICHTVSFSPIHPYRRLNVPPHLALEKDVAWPDSRPRLSRDYLLQSTSLSTPAEDPFPHQQFIGQFENMKRSDFDPQGYDLIYEKCGVLMHTECTPEIAHQIVKLTRSLLSLNGILITASPILKNFQVAFTEIAKENSEIFSILCDANTNQIYCIYAQNRDRVEEVMQRNEQLIEYEKSYP